MELSKTAKRALREKAAKMLGRKLSEIKSVSEHYQGATVFKTNGETRIIQS
ncbi:hypothetical protein [Iningainema tapete]|uniref:hypothetical protein n=1 Tax=Iningainema tapete TaxID=2806730 RepID=UPI0030D7E44E